MAERILIVEDDTTIRVTLGEVLGKLGYETVEVESGRAALERARLQQFDLVLLDLRLPDMHGIEVLGALREADSDALVVVMTAFPEVRTAIASIRAGAYDYLNKPFDLDDLKELVRRALETRRLRLEVARLRISAAQPADIEGLIGSSPAFLAMLPPGACRC